jgi:hypothetical protein
MTREVEDAISEFTHRSADCFLAIQTAIAEIFKRLESLELDVAAIRYSRNVPPED